MSDAERASTLWICEYRVAVAIEWKRDEHSSGVLLRGPEGKKEKDESSAYYLGQRQGRAVALLRISGFLQLSLARSMIIELRFVAVDGDRPPITSLYLQQLTSRLLAHDAMPQPWKTAYAYL